MLPNQTIYTMRKGKRAFSPCGKCGHPVKPGRKYIIDPVKTEVVYHAVCYQQQYKKYEANR